MSNRVTLRMDHIQHPLDTLGALLLLRSFHHDPDPRLCAGPARTAPGLPVLPAVQSVQAPLPKHIAAPDGSGKRSQSSLSALHPVTLFHSPLDNDPILPYNSQK